MALSFGFNTYGNGVEVNVVNKHPVKGEQFSVQFKISVTGNEEAYISFDPEGVEVLGKRNQGLSIQTSFVNGKIQTKREKIIAYDLVASKEGVAWLRNIEVEVGDKVLKHPKVRIKIFNFARKNREVFVQAEMSKENLYVGEGVDVKYFLYFRVPVVATEIKKFPTFNGFLKRDFLKEKQETRVNYGGKVYEKVLVYSVRLYPEKPGNLYIDPITLNVVYESRSSSFPFGSSPFFGGQRYSKSLVSEKIKINVLPLPEDGFPGNYTGLVGKHDFNLSINKSKFLVNEAIELKLEAKGPGALEKLEIPEIYFHPELEEFNTTSDLNVGAKPPFKKVDYTYLGRSAFSIKERDLKLYYFDPEKKEYVGVVVKVPPLIVAGGGYAINGKGKNNDNEQTSNIAKDFGGGIDIVAPLFSQTSLSLRGLNLVKSTVYFLALITVILLFELLFKLMSGMRGEISRAELLYRDIKSNGITYSKLYSLLLMLFRDKKVLDLAEEIEKTNIPSELKEYFLNLLRKLEKSKFSNESSKEKKHKLNKTKFNDLLKLINENNKVT
jgi:hypothetical protein